MRRVLILTPLLLLLLAACTPQQSSSSSLLLATPYGFFALQEIPLTGSSDSLEAGVILENPSRTPLTQGEVVFTGVDPSLIQVEGFDKHFTLPPASQLTLNGTVHVTLPEGVDRLPFTLRAFACVRLQPLVTLALTKHGVTSYTQPDGPLQIVDTRVSGRNLLVTLRNTAQGLVFSQYGAERGSCRLPADSWLGRIDARREDGYGLLINGQQYSCEVASWLGMTVQEQHAGRLTIRCELPQLSENAVTGHLTFAYRYREPLFTQQAVIIRGS